MKKAISPRKYHFFRSTSKKENVIEALIIVIFVFICIVIFVGAIIEWLIKIIFSNTFRKQVLSDIRSTRKRKEVVSALSAT